MQRHMDDIYSFLEPFEKNDALALIDTVERWQEKAMAEFDLHFVHASDEWYILAEKQLPDEESYDDYLQLENGVGMVRLMLDEFEEEWKVAVAKRQAFMKIPDTERPANMFKKEKITVITGRLVYPYICDMAERTMSAFPEKEIQVLPIINHFFGERITVTGLLTGQDIIKQCKEVNLGNRLLLPENVLRSGETVLLDDITVEDIQKSLQVPIDIVKSSGYGFLDCILK